MSERICREFWLVDATGGRHFPVRIRNRETGKVLFRASNSGNRMASVLEIADVEMIADLVVNKGYSVRVQAEDPPYAKGLIGLNKGKMVGYGSSKL